MSDLNAIEIRGVAKYYGYGEARVAAVQGANLNIRQNEFFTLLGP
jgi:ABC-type Fe3+/spermidine/putrescine transport system ATPase subunit